MKIKKVFITLLLLHVVIISKAQYLGITGGTTYSTINYDHPVNINKLLPGFHLGVLVEKPLISNGLFLRTGLVVVQKGSSYKGMYYSYGYGGPGSYYVEDDKTKKKLTYIDLPVLLEYKHKIQNIYILGKFGPSFSKGLLGKEIIDSEEDSKIKFDGKDHNKYDFGLNYGVGFEWNKNLQFMITYQIGLANIKVDDIKQRNQVLQFSIAYYFRNLYFVNSL